MGRRISDGSRSWYRNVFRYGSCMLLLYGNYHTGGDPIHDRSRLFDHRGDNDRLLRISVQIQSIGILGVHDQHVSAFVGGKASVIGEYGNDHFVGSNNGCAWCGLYSRASMLHYDPRLRRRSWLVGRLLRGFGRIFRCGNGYTPDFLAHQTQEIATSGGAAPSGA